MQAAYKYFYWSFMQLAFSRRSWKFFVPQMPSLISCLIANKSAFKVYSPTLQMSNWFLPEIDC